MDRQEERTFGANEGQGSVQLEGETHRPVSKGATVGIAVQVDLTKLTAAQQAALRPGYDPAEDWILDYNLNQ
jgi:hypothetical protein